MTNKEILQFISLELQKAIEEKSKERIFDLGTTAEILYELSEKQNDRISSQILERIDYIVFHYDEEFSFTEQYFQEIENFLEKLA